MEGQTDKAILYACNLTNFLPVTSFVRARDVWKMFRKDKVTVGGREGRREGGRERQAVKGKY